MPIPHAGDDSIARQTQTAGWLTAVKTKPAAAHAVGRS